MLRYPCSQSSLKLAVGSDEKTVLTDFVVEELKRRGHEVTLSGPLEGEAMGWPDVGEKIGVEVSTRRADQGVLFCWTGTGVTIAANKVPGVRAALCGDAETAKGARMWDDANVLAMSLRSTSTAVAKEICDAWLETAPDEAERATIAKVESPHPALPRKRGRED